MTEFRSNAEKFVTEFLDYVYQYDIKDMLNKQTQRMERSAGVETLIKMAQAVFPDRQKGPNKLTQKQTDAAIRAANNVVDTRKMFSRKVATNGGLRGLIMQMAEGDPEATETLFEFVKAEKGIKDFGDD